MESDTGIFEDDALTERIPVSGSGFPGAVFWAGRWFVSGGSIMR